MYNDEIIETTILIEYVQSIQFLYNKYKFWMLYNKKKKLYDTRVLSVKRISAKHGLA